MTAQKLPVLFQDIYAITNDLCNYIGLDIHRQDFNDRELSFLAEMDDLVLACAGRPSVLQIQWLYRLYFKHIDGEEDNDAFEEWQKERFNDDERLVTQQQKRSW